MFVILQDMNLVTMKCKPETASSGTGVRPLGLCILYSGETLVLAQTSLVLLISVPFYKISICFN